MKRLTLLLSFALGLLGAVIPAQELSRDEFRKMVAQAIDLNDEKLMDKAVKRGSREALFFFEELWFDALKGSDPAEVKCKAMQASWARCFEGSQTLEKLQRWCDGCDAETFAKLRRARDDSGRLWNHYSNVVSKDLKKPQYRELIDGYKTLAKTTEGLGHYAAAGEMWSLASVVASKMPEKSIEEREEVVFYIEQQLTAMDAWDMQGSEHYIKNKEFVRAELARIEEAKKKGEKREAAGYDADAKGVDALVMPNVPAAVSELHYEAQKDWQKENDYGPKNGMVPPYWWLIGVAEVGTSQQFLWFKKADLHLLRTGGNKFAVSSDPNDPKAAFDVDVGGKAKLSEFWLGPDRKQPYAMWFWSGGERELVNVAECNFSPSEKYVPVYFRSAASWRTQIGKDTLVLYDDSANGTPGDGDPFAAGLKSHMVGDTVNGTPVPLLDSMRLGKDRVPFSQFVKLQSGWHHLQVIADSVSVRPLNPEFFKTGKVKLTWSGPKPTAPVQLVIQGRGDYASAFYDLASGQEVEVPAGEYAVVFGRLLNGKGARVQSAQIYPGPSAQAFTVEEGKTFDLQMGAPFKLVFTRDGDQNVSVESTRILVGEKSGCVLTALQGSPLHCELLLCKDDSGKGAKVIGEFVPFTDGNLAVEASRHYNEMGFLAASFPMPKGYKNGAMVFATELPAEGMKLQLVCKKSPLFGKLESDWQ